MHPGVTRSVVAVALGWALLVSASAEASTVTVFDSISGSTPASTTGDYVSSAFTGPLYASFSTGSAATLTEIQLELRSDDPLSSVVSVSLLPDNATSPGGPAVLLGTIPNGVIGTGFGTFTLSGLSQTLTAGTRYWIELADAGTTSTAQWAYTANNTGPGVIGEYWDAQYTGAPVPNSGSTEFGAYPYEMRVTVDVAATPLPATLPMFAGGAGLLGLLMAGHKRRRSSS